MSEYFVGEIRMFAGSFAPVNWALCDGQLLQPSQYDALFSLLGTKYGGDGRTTFGLPDLRGRAPIHFGSGPNLSPYNIADRGGVEMAYLSVDSIPSHDHGLRAESDDADSSDPLNRMPAKQSSAANPMIHSYKTAVPAQAMHPDAIRDSGGSQPHYNMQPYQCVNFIICVERGTFPPRN